MLMCCLVGAFSRPKTDLVRRRHTYLHTIQHTHMHNSRGSHTADTFTLLLAYASAAKLSAAALSARGCAVAA